MTQETTIEFYELRKVKYDPRQNFIATAATIDCSLCGRNIDGMGGPGDGPICVPCGKALKSGQLRGAVKWTKEP